MNGVLPLRLAQVPNELVAGATLAALAIPEVMGYTHIAGTPLITGLYTMLIPAALFALFGSSRHLVVGADSATAAILASGLIGLAAVGTDQYMALAMALAIMVGALLLMASAFGLGFMADFLSRPVLVGFLSGVGIQVAWHAVSDLAFPDHHHLDPIALFQALPGEITNINVAAVGIAAATLACLVAGNLVQARWHIRAPAAMAVVIVAIGLSWSYDWGAIVPVVGSIPTGFPRLGFPDIEMSLSLVLSLLPTAFAMAVVVLAQSAATARAYATRANETLDESKDLFALGLANFGAGLSGTFVVNGSPTKTAMVSSAGGQTQLSLLTMVCVVAVVLIFLTAPLAYLPQAVLSGVVLLIGFDLIDVSGLIDIYRRRRAEFWVALSTIAAVVLFGVEQGIGYAVLVSIISHTRHGYRPSDMILTEDATGALSGKPLDDPEQIRPGLLIYRFTHSMYFANAQQMKSEILAITDITPDDLRWLCIDISAVDDVDYSAEAVLSEISRTLEERAIRLVFVSNVSEPRARSREQIIAEFGEANMFDSLKALLMAFSSETGNNDAL